jgi:hypothetical protein
MDGANVDERAGSSALCLDCVDALDATGAGIMLMTAAGHRGVLCSSDAASGVVEELQFTLGEGPCVDVCDTGLPVLEPDLAAPGVSRWPAFTPPAVRAGVRAIFGFPLHVGPIQLGALDIYNDYPGVLKPGQLAEAVTLADVLTRRVLDLQADVEPGSLASELADPETLRASVHQASGMLSARYGISVDAALLRLRAHAFSVERPINDVASDVVARRLNIQ